MTGKVRDAASWKAITDMQVRDTTWKTVLEAKVRDAGAWKSFYVAGFTGFIRPDADSETSGWTSTPLWSKLDEVSPDDATTQIRSSTVSTQCPSTVDHDFEVALSNPGDTPSGNETMTVRVRAYVDEISGFVITRQILIELKEASAVIASTTRNLGFSYSTHEMVLSQAQKDSISNWNNLLVRCRTRVCVDSGGDSARSFVTWIETEFVA